LGDGQRMQGRPECHGRLDVVFPMGADGLREVAAGCWDCQSRVDCLRLAVAADRDQGRPDRLTPAGQASENNEQSGVGGFLRRWSRLKSQAATRERG